MKGRGEIDATVENLDKLIYLISDAIPTQTFDLAYALGAKHALKWVLQMGIQDILSIATPAYISPKVFLDKKGNL